MISLRGRQPEWFAKVHADWERYNRLLFVAPGGIGKGTMAGALALAAKERGQKTLITENRERLTLQMAERVRNETGLEVDVEMGKLRASPHADVIVGNVQSLARHERLTGFSPDHFGVYIPDECHLMLAPQPLRISNYFFYGAESLAEDWIKPENGLYIPKCKACGFTASPDIGERRNLGEWFEHTTVNFSFLSAIEEGWLVGIVEKNLPVKIDTRKFRRRQTSEGAGFNIGDESAALVPIIAELAKQIVEHAKNRKTICFLPSVECSRMMADSLNGMGMNAIFVSGDCLDKNEKTIAYNEAPPGTVLVNCALVTYGIDFPDTDCVAIFSAVISKCNYIQKVYRGTRVLPGTVSDAMTAEQRVAAIAASRKPYLLLLSPFFVSERISICEPFDLFGNRPEGVNGPKEKPDFTKPAEIRDYIKALEKAADKHAHKQPRTYDPVAMSVSLGIPQYEPANAQEAAPATKEEKDYLLARNIDTTRPMTSGQAQVLIARLRLREVNKLASPVAVQQLLRLKWPAELASKIGSKQAGVLIWKGVEYVEPTADEPTDISSTPPLPAGQNTLL